MSPWARWNGNILYEAYPELAYGNFWYHRPFGRRESFLLAEMVRSLGRERFAHFWTSNETVPVAFEQTAGEPLEQWTSRWAASQYGQVPPRGPGMTSWAWLMSGALIIIALLITARASGRRQFI